MSSEKLEVEGKGANKGQLGHWEGEGEGGRGEGKMGVKSLKLNPYSQKIKFFSTFLLKDIFYIISFQKTDIDSEDQEMFCKSINLQCLTYV